MSCREVLRAWLMIAGVGYISLIAGSSLADTRQIRPVGRRVPPIPFCNCFVNAQPSYFITSDEHQQFICIKRTCEARTCSPGGSFDMVYVDQQVPIEECLAHFAE